MVTQHKMSHDTRRPYVHTTTTTAHFMSHNHVVPSRMTKFLFVWTHLNAKHTTRFSAITPESQFLTRCRSILRLQLVTMPSSGPALAPARSRLGAYNAKHVTRFLALSPASQFLIKCRSILRLQLVTMPSSRTAPAPARSRLVARNAEHGTKFLTPTLELQFLPRCQSTVPL